MKRVLLSVCVLGLLTYALLSSNSLATAQSTVYELSQSFIGSGGTISGGAYEANIVVGDPVADEVSGGAYSVGGGILGGGPRSVVEVTPTATPTETEVPTATPTLSNPVPTATPTEEGEATATPTATATPPSGGSDVEIYLPLVGR
jgi:hypothetical protein